MWSILSMAGVLPKKKFAPTTKEPLPRVEVDKVRIR
jgi:hypothetical protein